MGKSIAQHKIAINCCRIAGYGARFLSKIATTATGAFDRIFCNNHSYIHCTLACTRGCHTSTNTPPAHACAYQSPLGIVVVYLFKLIYTKMSE